MAPTKRVELRTRKGPSTFLGVQPVKATAVLSTVELAIEVRILDGLGW